ncbi:type II secretion system minor pseudopilin [Frigoriglobus tundricola]|uniref:T2SS protein K first SAM-like domain-containing protein n=1 Tax=Frigoriglobus tundricola TaxID=2774151 RepID=A0A6M5YSY6_9BACT|nr:type II secretion system protein GspK [Frigoriglobus tundricola]QJW97187.1 hypothetical protein FTUN_4752 [Frigoriglobus tundricola]
MKLRTSGAAHRSHPRDGYVIFAVLIVIVVLSLVGYRFADSMTSEYRAGVRLGDDAQVKMAAISGLNYAAAMLSDSTTLSSQLSGNPFDNEGTFGEVQLTPSGGTASPGRAACFSVRSVAVNDDGTYSQKYGVIDEGGKLNINSLIGIDPTGQALDTALMAILTAIMPQNGTNQTIADSIADWLDADDTARSSGAESSYYQGLSPSYSAKNGPLNSLDELLLVQGVTPYILYGGDTNRNGVQDAGEVDATRGLADYITVYGREINLSSSGTQRIYLNDADLATLYTQLQAAVGDDMATYIMAAKLFPTSAVPASSSGNQSQATPPSQIASAVQTAMNTAITNGTSGSQIQSLMDLINSQVTVAQTDAEGRTAPALVVPSPLNTSSQLQTLLPLLMDQTTVKQAVELVPRININTAPMNVLLAIPNMTATLATTISTQRASNVATDPGTVSAAWLVTSNTLKPAQFKSMEAYITGGTMIYRVQSIGYFKGTASNTNGGATGPLARMEAVIDTNQGAPRFLFVRDLSDLDNPRGFLPDQ